MAELLVLFGLGRMYAGLRRSTETLSDRPLMSNVKYLSDVAIMRNGPS